MTIRSSLYFIFNGESSVSYGITSVNISSSLFEEPFLPQREILEVKIRGNNVPYYQGYKEQPLQFDLTLFIDDQFDESKLRDLARWFDVDYYKSLMFSENVDRIFYVQPVDQPKLVHNGLQGYIQVSFRCAHPYSFSPVYTSPIYDLSSNTLSGTSIDFINQGDINCQPILLVEMVSGSDFSIINNSDGGRTFSFTGLSVGEQLTIDNEREDITTSLPLTYRINNHNGVFLNFPRGVNRLTVKGNIKLQFKTQFKRRQ